MINDSMNDLEGKLDPDQFVPLTCCTENPEAPYLKFMLNPLQLIVLSRRGEGLQTWNVAPGRVNFFSVLLKELSFALYLIS